MFESKEDFSQWIVAIGTQLKDVADSLANVEKHEQESIYYKRQCLVLRNLGIQVRRCQEITRTIYRDVTGGIKAPGKDVAGEHQAGTSR